MITLTSDSMADLFTDVNGEMRDEYPPFHPMDSLGAARFCAIDHQRNLSGPPAARVWSAGDSLLRVFYKLNAV